MEPISWNASLLSKRRDSQPPTTAAAVSSRRSPPGIRRCILAGNSPWSGSPTTAADFPPLQQIDQELKWIGLVLFLISCCWWWWVLSVLLIMWRNSRRRKERAGIYEVKETRPFSQLCSSIAWAAFPCLFIYFLFFCLSPTDYLHFFFLLLSETPFDFRQRKSRVFFYFLLYGFHFNNSCSFSKKNY